MSSRIGKRFVLAAIIGFAAVVMLPAAGFADLVVMSSNAPGYSPGDTYSEDTVFTVPDKKYLKLKRKGTTHKLKGPFVGYWNQKSAGSSASCSSVFGCGSVSNGSSRGELPGVTRGQKKD